MGRVHVVFSTDDAFAHAVSVAMWSVLRTSTAGMDIHILDNELSAPSQNLMRKVADHFTDTKVFFHPLPEALTAFTPSGALRGTLARLLIPEILSDVERVIYLDADILAESDIAELFAQDLDGALVGVVRNFRTVEKQYVAKSSAAPLFRKTVLAAMKERARLLRETGRNDPENYINAGVFLLDNKALQAEPVIVRRLADFQSAASKSLKDQDWLYHVFNGRMRYLHPRWNCYWTIGRSKLWAFPAQERSLYRAARASPGIVHFVGTNPWSPVRFEAFVAGAHFRARWRRAAEDMRSALS